MLEESKDYKMARELIAHLREDPDLRNYVYEEVYDEFKQSDNLNRIARASGAFIAVTPGDMNNETGLPEAPSKYRVTTYFSITVLSTKEATLRPPGFKSSASFRAALIGRVIASIRKFEPANNCQYWDNPRFISATTVTLSEDWANLAGKIIEITINITY